MATVVFDFDSTIISVESLELILEEQSPGKKSQIQVITEEGMRGHISFSESLERRLALAAPSRDEVLEFGHRAIEWLTPGIDSLIQELQQRGVEVWIVSGGVKESILPLAKHLDIPESCVQAVTLKWDEEGLFDGIDTTNPFCSSKHEGISLITHRWDSPTVVVGDAMSDYLIYEKGYADYFILFTKHFRCDELLNKKIFETGEVSELRRLLFKLVIEDEEY